MPNVHKNPLMAWRPAAGLAAWAREEAKRRGTLSSVLNSALEHEKALTELPGDIREEIVKVLDDSSEEARQ